MKAENNKYYKLKKSLLGILNNGVLLGRLGRRQTDTIKRMKFGSIEDYLFLITKILSIYIPSKKIRGFGQFDNDLCPLPVGSGRKWPH